MRFPDVAVTGDEMPPEQQVRITVEVVEQFSEQTPARLQIQFRNEAATPRSFLFGPDPPFGSLRGNSRNGSRLHVLPADAARSSTGRFAHVIPSRPVEECWQLADRYDRIDRGVLWNADPRETTSMTYVVLDDLDTDDCLSAGVYRFEGRWGEQDAETTEEWFDWGFTLTLS